VGSGGKNRLKIRVQSHDATDMPLLRISGAVAGGFDDTHVDGTVAKRSVQMLQRQLDILEIERDCLREALIDAGYSLKVEPIAKYAFEASRRGPTRVWRRRGSGSCRRLLRRSSRSETQATPA
jgi:hypothetical protein